MVHHGMAHHDFTLLAGKPMNGGSGTLQGMDAEGPYKQNSRTFPSVLRKIVIVGYISEFMRFHESFSEIAAM